MVWSSYQSRSRENTNHLMTKYNLLRNGKIIFWDLSENELLDRLEDFAVEQYVTGENINAQITYEPVKEEN